MDVGNHPNESVLFPRLFGNNLRVNKTRDIEIDAQQCTITDIKRCPPMKLTEREHQLLNAAAKGRTDREISSDLQISRDTVSSYWRRILLKYSASSRTECVARYAQESASYEVEQAVEEKERLATEVKEHAEAYARESAEKNMLAAITKATLNYIRCGDNLKETFAQLLSDVLALTQSEYGFLGEVIYENGIPYLQEHAITNIAWNDESRELYEKHHEEGLIFRNLNTLFGQVMVTKKTIISNDVINDPRGTGAPVGHPTLNAFLGLPVFDGDQLIGMIGLANRPGGYSNELVEYLAPLTATCATYITGWRIKRERQEMQRRISSSEALVKDLIDQISYGLVFESTDRVIEFVNQAFIDLFRAPYQPSDLIGISCEKSAESVMKLFVDPNDFVRKNDLFIQELKMVKGDMHDLTDGRTLVRDFYVIQSEGITRGYLWSYREKVSR